MLKTLELEYLFKYNMKKKLEGTAIETTVAKCESKFHVHCR